MCVTYKSSKIIVIIHPHVWVIDLLNRLGWAKMSKVRQSESNDIVSGASESQDT